jgi:ABC-type transporter Mla subunit MlaD
MILNMSKGADNSGAVIEAVESLLTGFKTEISGLIAGVTTDVAALKSSVSTLSGDVSTLSSSVSTVNTNVAAVKTDVAGVKSNVSTLSTNLSTVSTAVGNIPKAAVKSVQRGVHSGSATDNITITINTVNPSKCMVLLQRTRDTTNLPSLVSIASTSFTVTTSSAVYSTSPNTASPFSWQVIEFY